MFQIIRRVNNAQKNTIDFVKMFTKLNCYNSRLMADIGKVISYNGDDYWEGCFVVRFAGLGDYLFNCGMQYGEYCVTYCKVEK